MADKQKPTGQHTIRDGGTIKGGVVNPSQSPVPRPTPPTGQGGGSPTTNKGSDNKK